MSFSSNSRTMNSMRSMTGCSITISSSTLKKGRQSLFSMDRVRNCQSQLNAQSLSCPLSMSPWFNREIRRKIIHRDHCLQKAKTENNEHSRSKYKRARNDVTRSIRSAKSNYIRNTFHENQLNQNPKSF